MGNYRANIVQILKDNSQRYRSATVMKELLQNADDAKAECFDVAVVEAPPENLRSSFFRQPALLCANDGRFTKANRMAITQIAASSKSSEVDAVGRFGLGQKSVFSIADAFCFLGFRDDLGTWDGEILNPFEDEADEDLAHPDWKLDRNDKDRVVALAREIFGEGPRFFLWVPFRQRARTAARRKPIHNEFFDEPGARRQFLEHAKTLAPLLAQTGHVRRLRVWSFAKQPSLLLHAERHSGPPDAWLSRPKDEPGADSDRRWQGEIRIQPPSPDHEPRIIFARAVERLSTSYLAPLKGNPNWPNGADDEPTKAMAHGATTVLFERRAPSGGGSVDISDAIFFPLGDHPAFHRATRGALAWSLLLHGYYFPDAGRQAILREPNPGTAPPATEDALVKRWNEELRRSAVLPTVLPALYQSFLHANDLDEAVSCVGAVVDWAQRSGDLHHLTRDHLLGFGPDEQGVTRVGLFPSRVPFLGVPQPPEKSRLALAGLVEWIRRKLEPKTVLWAGMPLLGGGAPQWTQEDVVRVLSEGLEAHLSEPEGATYVEMLLSCVGRDVLSTPVVCESLVGMFRRYVVGRTFVAAAAQPAVRALVRYLPAERRLFAGSHELATRCSREVQSVVVLPPSLKPDDVPEREPALACTEEELRALLFSCSTNNGRENELKKSIVKRDRRALAMDDVATVECYSTQTEGMHWITGKAFEDLRGRGHALLREGMLQPENVANRIAAAFDPPLELVLVAPECVPSGVMLQPLSPERIFQLVLDETHALGSLDRRSALFDLLIKQPRHQAATSARRRALRLLLHGHRGDHGAEELWLLESTKEIASLGQRLLDKSEAWRLVDSTLARKLSRDDSAELGISPRHFDWLATQLAIGVENRVDWSTLLRTEDCELLVEQLDPVKHATLWTALPVHRTASGGRVALGPTIVLADDRVPPAFERHVLRLADDVAVSRKLELVPGRWSLARVPAFLKGVGNASGLAAGVLDCIADEAPARTIPQALREIPWLVAADGQPVAPEDVLALPAPVLESTRRLLVAANVAPTFRTMDELHPDLLQHRAWDRVATTLVSAENAALDRLTLQVGEVARQGIQWRRFEERHVWREALEQPALDADPVWRLIRATDSGLDEPSSVAEVFRGRCSAPTAERMLGVLCSSTSPESCVRLVEAYVRAIVRDGAWLDVASRIALVSATGRWMPARALVPPGDDNALSRDHVLHAGLTRVCEELPSEGLPASVGQEHLSTRDPLTLLKEWAEPTAAGGIAVGALIALLCPAEGSREEKLAQELLANTNERLGDLQNAFFGDRVRRPPRSLALVPYDGHAQVRSVAGTMATVPRDQQQLRTLLHGRVPARGVVALLDVPPYLLPDLARRQELMRRTADRLASSLGLTIDLSSFFGDRSSLSGDQVEVARKRLVEALPSQLDALGLRRSEPFLSALANLDEAAHHHAAMRRSSFEDDKAKARTRLDAARDALVHLLERDSEARKTVLGAVRRKMRQHFQYAESRVLFELFQNAHDATNQALSLGMNLPERAFVVRLTSVNGTRVVACKHFGRPVNDDRAAPAGDRATLGYSRDLYRMLLLNSSDKDPASNTGRYGLGFKSVHLVSEAPVVRSGALCFRIDAGLWPTPLVDRPFDPSTVIELPLSEEVDERALLEDFQTAAPLLLVCSRTISRIELPSDEPDARSRIMDARWTSLHSCPSASLISTGGSDIPSVLTFGDERTRVVFGWSGAGFHALPTTIPSIWCTAPTEERWRIPFVINAPFEVDIGRTRLATTERNEDVFRHAGRVLEQGLEELARALNDDPEKVLVSLGVQSNGGAVDALVEGIWTSFWRVLHLTGHALSSRTDGSEAFVRKVLAPAVSVLARRGLIPNGLRGARAALVSLSGPITVLDERLCSEEVLDEILHWKPLGMPGVLLSGAVLSTLRQVGAGHLVASRPIQLRDLVERVLDEPPRADVERAKTLSGLDQLAVRTRLSDDETRELRGLLWTVELRAESGEWGRAGTRLMDSSFLTIPETDRSTRDEADRAAFAPSRLRLHPSYRDQACIRFIRYARGEFTAEARVLATWMNAAAPDRQPACFQYLLSGLLRDEVCRLLRKAPLSWCPNIDALAQLKVAFGLPDDEEVRLSLGLFGVMPTRYSSASPVDAVDDEDEDDEPLAPLPPFPPLTYRSPRERLLDVQRWWAANHLRWSRHYDSSIYPETWPASQRIAELPKEEHEAWMRMFCLAAAHKLGRVTRQQNRDFLAYLANENTALWECIRNSAAEAPDWAEALRRWIDQDRNEQWSAWMGLYASLFRLHRSAATYIRLLVRWPQRRDVPDPSVFFNPNNDPALRGSQVSAPPFARALGAGGVWLVRELARADLKGFREERFAPLAYYPKRASLDFVRRLGLAIADAENPFERSRLLYEQLRTHLGNDHGHFGYSYDLPFLILSEEESARREAGLQ